MFRNIKLVLGYNVVTMGHELWLQWKETEKNMKKRAKYVFFHHFSGGGFLQTVNGESISNFEKSTFFHGDAIFHLVSR